MGRRIIIRMDDICETMDFDKFMQYKTLFDRYNIKPLLGIVPCSKDEKLIRGIVPDFWNYISALVSEGWLVAMHGYNHLYTSTTVGLVTKRKKSEFAGLSVSTQIDMLRKGKNALEEKGIKTNIFMPPGHSYDRKTLIAMKETGFKYLSDGRSSHTYCLESIKCVPADSSYKLNKYGILTICIHSNDESQTAFHELEKFIEKNKINIISFDQACLLKEWPYFICRFEEIMRMNLRDMLLWIRRVVVQKK